MVVAGLLSLFLSVAAAFPTEDAKLEHSVLTPTPAQVISRGRWSVSKEGLAMTGRDPAGGYNYWLPTTDRALVGDGVVRARIRRGARLDCTILFRATADPGQPRDFSAYGLSLEPDEVVLYRWERGDARPLSTGVKVADLASHAELEVVIYLVGPQILATVYDAQTLALLATVSARDAALPSGHVGLRAQDRQTADTVLTHLSVQPARLSVAPERFPFGRTRLVRLAAADRSKVPADVGVTREQTDGEATWLLTDAEGLERMRRAGLSPVDLGSETPWWIHDASYLAARGKPVVRTEKGFDLTLSYKDPEMVEALLRGWHALYPDVTRLERLAVTSQGRPLWALRVSDTPAQDEGEPAVLLVGANHGDELPSVDYVLDAIGALLEGRGDPQIDRWVSGLDIWCVPMANPDGANMFLNISTAGGRRNARDIDNDGPDPWDGIDLNRNYPFRWGSLGEVGSSSWRHHDRYRGPSAGSEVETRALMGLASRYRPVAVLSFHTNATTILSPYTIDGAENPEPDEAWAIAEALAEAAGEQPNGRGYKVKRKLYSVDGTDQDWYRHSFGSAAFIVEGSHRTPTEPELRIGTVAGVRGIYRTLFDRVLDGPRVSGRVLDAAGRPLEAEVRVEGIALRAGERWSSRPQDGRFDRLLPASGSYTLRVLMDGYREETRAVDVQGVADVDIVLRRL